MRLGEQSAERGVIIGVLAGLFAAAAFAFGFAGASVGILAGAALGLFNYWISRKTLEKLARAGAGAGQALIVMRSMVRMLVSALAMVTAIPFGVEAVFGVFIGLLLELTTYYGEIFLFLAGRR